ncbi:MAG: hypothetical protein H5T69_18500, partial [Chloroflexi bacterium]|nr:hypothetical protein [Chloroflexota bacterium]
FLRGDPLKEGEEERYGLWQTTEEGYSLYEHCRRAIEEGTTSGLHGLPLMGTGDWNDGMNRVGREGRGESVWLAWFLAATLDRFAPLAESWGDQELARNYRERARQLRRAVNETAWDGEWYLRAFYDDGEPLGSSRNIECQIDSLAQSWAVLWQQDDLPEVYSERPARAVYAALQRLYRPEDALILLFAPPFDETPHDPGYIKGYPPGVRENGGQYTHAAVWLTWSVASLGRGDLAYELFRALNPLSRATTTERVERYRVEPYVVAADIYALPPHVGRGGWTWYTGSAAWLYRLGIEAILGLERRGNTLCITPCIPSCWEGYQITYRYQGSEYHITVHNPEHVCAGVVSVELDGREIEDQAVPLCGEKAGVHEVVVRLGRGVAQGSVDQAELGGQKGISQG